MNGGQVKALCDALCSAFNQDTLDQMLLFSLDKDRSHLVGSGSFETVVFRVIEAAVREGWLATLIDSASSYNPGNAKLREFCNEQWERGVDKQPYRQDSGQASVPQGELGGSFVPFSIGTSFEPFFSRGPGDNADWALVIRILNADWREVIIRRAVYFLDSQELVPILLDAKRSQVYSTGFEVKFGEQWKKFEHALMPGSETITYVPLRTKATASELPQGRRGDLLLNYAVDGRSMQHRAVL